jgi:hypothetical protein
VDLKIILGKIDANSDKLLHGRSPSLGRSGDHVLALDAVEVRPSTSSIRMRARIAASEIVPEVRFIASTKMLPCAVVLWGASRSRSALANAL